MQNRNRLIDTKSLNKGVVTKGRKAGAQMKVERIKRYGLPAIRKIGPGDVMYTQKI